MNSSGGQVMIGIESHAETTERNRPVRAPNRWQLIQLRHIPDRKDFCDRWNALVQQAKRPEVFLTWQWARAVEKAYGESRRPWVLLLEDEDKSLAGLAALATDAGGGEVSFLAGTTADYCDFLSLPGYREAIVEAVLAGCAKADANITLANLPADSETTAAIRQAAGKYGYHLFARPAYQCAQVSLRSVQQRASAKAGLRRKNMRRVITVMQRFSPRVEHLNSWEQAANELPAFFEAHVSRFLDMGRASNLADPDRRKFLEELGRLLADAGWLRMSRVQVEGKTVAWNYGFQFADSWFWYQPALDLGFEQSSPGVYLLAQIIMAACDDPNIKVVDLGLGAERYKKRFENSSRQTLHLILTRSFARHLRGIARYRSVQLLKRWPAAEKTVRAILRRSAE